MNQLVRILYVDDYPLDRELVRDALEKEHGGFELVEAASWADFETTLAQGDFDLVLSDFNILGFEGLQVLEAVRATDPHLPVIIVTGTGSEEVAAEAIKRGAADYVIKTPKHIQRLPHTIQAVLEKKRLEDERRQAEEALRESEERYRRLHQSMMDCFVQVKMSGEIEDANPSYLTMLGYSKEEIFKLRYSDITPQRWHKFEQEIVETRILPFGYSDVYEKEYIRKDGTVFPVELRTFLLRDAKGQPSGMWAIVRDITERKQVESRLRLQSAALDAAANAILITDRAGLIQWVNPAFCDLTGYTTAEAIGKNLRELVRSGQHDQAFYQNLWDTILAGQVWHGEIINRRKDGSLYPEEETITPVRNPQGEISHFIAIKQDVTSRKALEAENQNLTEQFYQAQKMDSIGQLAGGIAHDFNNLLVPIVGYAELGMMAAPPDSEPYTHFEQIKEAGARATSLTQQILAFSRRQVLEMTIVDLNQVIIEFERMLQRLIGETIILETHLVADLPVIKADRGQLEQILLNLVLNARDAMPNGGRLTIETAHVVLDEAYVTRHMETQPGPYVLLVISDTGHGMDAATRQRIFEPFFTTKTQGHGTGLGLSTVFGIVKQHDGNIWVYSEPGQGTTFKIYLPVAETLPPTTLPDVPAVGSLEGTETILVVEDEVAVRQLVDSALRMYGYRVMEADDPTTGLELASAYQGIIHLLLTDMVMPAMNGRELFQQLVVDRPGLKVLYMSGYTDDVITYHGVLDEGTPFLQKPFTVHSLLQKVRAVLG
jgi:two-component system cell cycle sensor histidine kinase/response regulator CckA